MTQISNLYASKVFSEHPISLYPLDDDVSYISLISDEKRLFGSGGWESALGDVLFDDSPDLPEILSPFKDNFYTQFSVPTPEPESEDFTFEIKSPDIFQLQDLNESLATFSISMYLYQSSFFINWYEVGYSYFNQGLQEEVETVSRVMANQGREWLNFDFSYLPNEYDSSNVKIIIRVNARAGGQESDYRFIVNGMCVGQWTETFSSSLLGITPELSRNGYLGYPITEYGIQENSGYYIVEDNKLLSKNQGLPLVYGSKTSTKIYPSKEDGKPSIIFPAKGFLNNEGKNNEYTFEFWINIKPNTNEEKRIFGPLLGTDGLYVKDGLITLSVGGEIASHYVSEWYRPMIVHISISLDSIYLFINGENVLNLPFNKKTINLASGNDWVGFYSYEGIEFFSIDCVAIYPYPISKDVAKRRFVYGQGTDSPEFVASSFDGVNSYINFSNAKYGVNKIYPDSLQWNDGFSDNLEVTRSSISVPSYSLPQVFIQGRNVQELYSDNKIVNEMQDDSFFTFRPNIEDNEMVAEGIKWNEPGYIYFDSLGFVDNLSSIYGVFSTKDIISRQPLMKINNSLTRDVLSIYIESKKVKYAFNNDILYEESIEGDSEGSGYDYYFPKTEYDDYPDNWSHPIAFGFNIENFSETFGYRIKRFLQSKDYLQAYFAGDGVDTFSYKVHAISFSNSLNVIEIEDKFLSNGIVDFEEYEDLVNHIASYTLVPLIRYGHFFMDISVSALWEEYFPLSSFASYVSNYEGEQYLDLDFLQVNLGYPSVTEIIEKMVDQFGWNYAELFLLFNSPAQKSYSILNNSSLSGYEIYEDLTTNKVLEIFLNTEKSSLRSYITFQLLSEGANIPLGEFPYTKDLYADKYIDANRESTLQNKNKPYMTKFEFLDKTIVFPPKAIDFNKIAIVFHFIIKQEGILSNPLVVRDFEIVSRALNHNELTSIGSESGPEFYSYVRSGVYFENKTNNPVLISKKRYPYLYLTEDAGLSTLGKQTKEKEYGITMPINKGKSNEYMVSAIQSWFKYNLTSFSSIAYPIFQIESLNKTIEFIIKSDPSGKRGVIVARNKKTFEIEQNVTYFQNGRRVKNPIVEKDEWFSLGVLFDEELIFNQFTGYMNFFRGVSFNNVSHYKPSGLGKTLEIIARPWRRVYEDLQENVFRWSYWYVNDNTRVDTRQNIVYNPNLSVDLTGWEAAGTGATIEIVNEGRFNDKSLKCITGSSINSGVRFANSSGERMSILPNTEYTASVYLKIPEESPNKTIRLRSRQYSSVSGGSVVSIESYQSIGITPIDGWIRLSFTLTSEPTAEALSFEVSQENNNESGSIFYVGNALVEKTENLNPKVNRYFDGDFVMPGTLSENNVWDGPEGMSASSMTYFVPEVGDVRQWESVYALTEATLFSLSPEDIYKAFIGVNGVVVDDGASISIDADTMRVLSSVKWSRFSQKPL
jgi:hypothetical protein